MELDPKNPTGVRTFDHDDFVSFPEYAAVPAALDALVKAIVRAQADDVILPVPQAVWLEIVSDVARSLPFADACDRCRNRREIDDPITFPAAASVEDRGLEARYVCPRCGHRWSCWWGLDLPVL